MEGEEEVGEVAMALVTGGRGGGRGGGEEGRRKKRRGCIEDEGVVTDIQG